MRGSGGMRMAHRVSMAHGTEIGVASRTGYAARWSSVTPDLTGDGAAFASCARGSDERASRKLKVQRTPYRIHATSSCTMGWIVSPRSCMCVRLLMPSMARRPPICNNEYSVLLMARAGRECSHSRVLSFTPARTRVYTGRAHVHVQLGER